MFSLTFYLLMLSICGVILCFSDPFACASSELYGRASIFAYVSKKSVMPPGHKTYRLEIPNGHFICYKNGQKYFVGEEVVACDSDISPTVHLVNNNRDAALVTRNGNLKEEATAHTIYYCDYNNKNE